MSELLPEEIDGARRVAGGADYPLGSDGQPLTTQDEIQVGIEAAGRGPKTYAEKEALRQKHRRDALFRAALDQGNQDPAHR